MTDDTFMVFEHWNQIALTIFRFTHFSLTMQYVVGPYINYIASVEYKF
jgi:hypothetical protein